MNKSILRDVANLSSGTLSTLTNLVRYSELDKIQESFVLFVDSSKDVFSSWMEAWNSFEWENVSLVEPVLIPIPVNIEKVKHLEMNEKRIFGLTEYQISKMQGGGNLK